MKRALPDDEENDAAADEIDGSDVGNGAGEAAEETKDFDLGLASDKKKKKMKDFDLGPAPPQPAAMEAPTPAVEEAAKENYLDSKSKKKKKVTEIMSSLCLLPLEIVCTNILSRLDVKSLCKVRCVSKSWYAMISDPLFIQTYQRNPLLLTMASNYEYTSFSVGDTKFRLTSLHKESKAALVDHEFVLNGTVGIPTLLQATCLDPTVLIYDPLRIYMFNPTTKDLILLPEKSLPRVQHVAAFGCVPSTNEYKVFRYTRDYDDADDKEDCYEMFTIVDDQKDNCWREIDEPPFDFITIANIRWAAPAVSYACGSIYFLQTPTYVPYVGLARLDLEREEWSVFPLPDGLPLSHILLPGYTEEVCLMSLSNVGGFLCLSHYQYDWTHMDLWFLKDYDKQHQTIWVKEYSIDTPFPINDWIIFVPLAIEKDGRILIKTTKSYSQVHMHYYDPKTRSLHELSTKKMKVSTKKKENELQQKKKNNIYEKFDVFFYIESLNHL